MKVSIAWIGVTPKYPPVDNFFHLNQRVELKFQRTKMVQKSLGSPVASWAREILCSYRVN